jgi:hypothetical protein
MTKAYVLCPLAPFPARWRDKLGPIRVMAGPVQGYVMCRRPHSIPFVLSVKELLNTKPHPHKGPFEIARSKGPRA